MNLLAELLQMSHHNTATENTTSSGAFPPFIRFRYFVHYRIRGARSRWLCLVHPPEHKKQPKKKQQFIEPFLHRQLLSDGY